MVTLNGWWHLLAYLCRAHNVINQMKRARFGQLFTNVKLFSFAGIWRLCLRVEWKIANKRRPVSNSREKEQETEAEAAALGERARVLCVLLLHN